jgi:two-component system, NtrC family, nitrogen regulation sensor histidine kinase NtrY
LKKTGKYLILVFGLLLISGAFYFDTNEQSNRQRLYDEATLKIENFLAKTLVPQKVLVNKYIGLYEATPEFEVLYNESKGDDLEVFIYQHDSLVFWSSQFLVFEPKLKFNWTEVYYQYLSDGFYRICSKTNSTGVTVYTFLKIKDHYPKDSRSFPRNKLNKAIGFPLGVDIVEKEQEEYFPISDEKGEKAFFIQIVNSHRVNSTIVFAYVIGLALLLWFLFIVFSPQRAFSKLVLLFFVLLCFRVALYFELIVKNLKQLPFFSPEVFAHSNWYASLGDLFLNLLLIYLLLEVVRAYIVSNKITFKYQRSLVYMATISILIFVFRLYYEIRHLVLDSNISFDFVRLDELSIFSILGICLLGFYFLIFVTFGRIIRLVIGTKHRNRIILRTFVVNCLLLLSYYLVIGDYDTNTQLFVILLFSLLSFAFFVMEEHKRSLIVRGQFVALFALVCAIVINDSLDIKENEYRKLFAHKLVYERNINLELALLEAENKFAESGFLNNYFNDTLGQINDEEFKEQLKFNYLSTFIQDFEIKIDLFNGAIENLPESKQDDYYKWLDLYRQSMSDNITQRFVRMGKGGSRGDFLAFFQYGSSLTSQYKAVIISLSQRFSSEKNVFSEFLGRTIILQANPYQYEYALYKDNKLERIEGNYPFQRVNKEFRPGQKEKFVESKEYSLYLFNPEIGSLLVIAYKQRGVLDKLTIFSFVLLFFVGLYFAFTIIRSVYRMLRININRYLHYKKAGKHTQFKLYHPRFKNATFQSKVLTFLFLELVFGFIVILYFVISLLQGSFYSRQTELVQEKVRSVSTDLEKYGFLEKNESISANRELLINLSSSYNIDINFYDKFGTLKATSNPAIFSYGFFNNKIHPQAFIKLANEELYSFNQEERIAHLKYNSYYQTYLNKSLEVEGYINLPYFGFKREISKELTFLSTNVVNIFVGFIFLTGLVSIVLSYSVSRPLKIIEEHLKKFRPDKSNNQIDWDSNDEIGRLIKIYNQVVKELELNIQKLAESEREGAWREMAKQVAHEIKNPLTPMKLNIQHLKRSVMSDEGEAEVKARVMKVAEMLIQQIDSLSRMAEEFASFAKMPEPEIQSIDLAATLKNVVRLFDKNPDYQIHLDLSNEAYKIKADEDQLQRVFVNILKNAYQARKSGESIELEISVTKHEGFLTISFKDNGTGISEDIKNRIFTPNFSSKTSGMGLGLAMSKKIIEHFGGKIRFESQPNEGTTFFISLPFNQH